MIRISRDNVAQPAVLDLDDPDSLASKEKVKAIAHVKDSNNHPKPNFSVYKHDSVKLALIELFHGKCAYCESPVNAVSARDIEHYRPKGQIDPGTGSLQIGRTYSYPARDVIEGSVNLKETQMEI